MWSHREPHEKEFPPDRLNLTRELGEGAFGVVHEAKAEGIEEEGRTSVVAVKQLRGEGNVQMVEDFFREVDFMSRLNHPRVVSLLGVCSQQEPFAMIFEYMDLGDLRSFLRDAAGLGENEEDDDKPGMIPDNPLLTISELLSIAVQVRQVLVYLHSSCIFPGGRGYGVHIFQAPGHTKLSGGYWAGGEDSRLWHVQRHLFI